jgi:SAM-dependent methyltransferase
MKTIPCEVCGSNQHRFLFEGRERVFGIPGVFQVVKCKGCGTIFINPQPEKETLKDYYPKSYYETDQSRYLEYPWLRKRVLEEYFGYGDQSDSSKVPRLLKKMVLFPFKFRYGFSIPFVQKGRLLDIGCGNGTELFRLKAMGWETYGVEIDEGAVRSARSKGLEVFAGDLFEANYPDQVFHVVRMNFVLEHLPNPRETLQEIKRILQPGGRIYISVQNARSLNYWLFGKRWFSLDVPRHYFSFTPKTIGRLLSSMGLKIKSIRFDSGTRTFLASLQYWVNDHYHEGAAGQSYHTLVSSHFLRHVLSLPCWAIDRLRLGDLMYLEVVCA